MNKLYYYNAFVTLNNRKTNVQFSEVLDSIILLNDDLKFRATRHGEYSLIKMRLPQQNRDYNDRSVCFANYRDRKPKLGEKRSDRLEDIADDVIESTSCFYQHINKLFIMEYNHYGAKAKQIENYLSEFLPKKDGEVWGVELVEIPAPIGLDDVLDSTDIRMIDIKLDVSSHQRRQINVPDEPESIAVNIIRDVVDTQAELGGNVAQIYFANGRKKGNSLNAEEVKKLLRVLDLDSDLYISIKVKYYSNILGKMNELDLKNAGVLKKEIEFEGDSWETIGDAIEEEFYDNGRTGQNHHTRFDSELIAAAFPKLVLENGETTTK